MRRTFSFLFKFIVYLMILPSLIGAGIAYARGWPASWRTANWSSSGVLPAAQSLTPATVIILASRTGRWKGIFAEHMSLVLKPANAAQWTRYDVVGWGSPIRRDDYAADAFWYGNVPRVIFRLEGNEAQALIPKIEQAIAAYPNSAAGSYVIWPGPNSNTFVAWVVRHTQGFDAELSPVAVGKDYLGPGLRMARAPSSSGYTVSLGGYVGATLALEEGLELHVAGSTIGIDVNDLAIKLPSLGKLSVLDLF
jgi:Protein of unknown function (DUF3750)